MPLDVCRYGGAATEDDELQWLNRQFAMRGSGFDGKFDFSSGELVLRHDDFRLVNRKTQFDATTFEFEQIVSGLPLYRSGISVTVRDCDNAIVGIADTSNAELFGDAGDLDPPLSLPAQDARGSWSLQHVEAEGAAPRYEAEPQVKMERGRQRYVYRFSLEELGRVPTWPFRAEPVDDSIPVGSYRIVDEWYVGFKTNRWRVLVDTETGYFLYVRALVGNVQGAISDHGHRLLASPSSLSRLTPLPQIDIAVQGVQRLKGKYVVVSDHDDPRLKPPTAPIGAPFRFAPGTHEYFAVNAYYYATEFFVRLRDLGFDVETYFGPENFPVEIDHVAPSSYFLPKCANDVNHVGFSFEEVEETKQSDACDPMVHWHEFGGHFTLQANIDAINFDFAHSCGDALAMIANWFRGTENQFPILRKLRPASRSVAKGWYWGGPRDTNDRNREEILTASLMRFFYAVGGGSDQVGQVNWGADLSIYLIIRAIGLLTPATEPKHPIGFYMSLLTASKCRWKTRNLMGGIFHKVLRWAFDAQRLFDSRLDVDISVNDGRSGEYDFTNNYWESPGITLDPREPGNRLRTATVEVDNLGLQAVAPNQINAYYCRPTIGLAWPGRWLQMKHVESTPVDINGKSLHRFEWEPTEDGEGKDVVLSVASHPQDPAVIESWKEGESVPLWQFVPHDNNIAMHAVVNLDLGDSRLVRSFWVENPYEERKAITLDARMGNTDHPMRNSFLNETFELGPGESKRCELDLDLAGATTSVGSIVVRALVDDIPIGGITFRYRRA